MSKYIRSSKNYLYTAWLGMVRRCTKPSHPAWNDYGGRGIEVCQRWLNSFEAFVEDMGDRPTSRHTLDRDDNNAGYSPSNCRWSTWSVQRTNQRPHRVRSDAILIDGKTLRQWSSICGVKYATLKARHKTGKRGVLLFAKDLRARSGEVVPR